MSKGVASVFLVKVLYAGRPGPQRLLDLEFLNRKEG